MECGIDLRMTMCPVTGRMRKTEDCKLEFDKIKLAWCSGFFDGEGCTYISNKDPKNDRKGIRITISQQNPEVLVKFKEFIGFGKIVFDRSRHSSYKYYTDRFEHIQQIIILLWPHLSALKRNQYIEKLKIYLESVRKIENWRKHRTHGNFGKIKRTRLLDDNKSPINTNSTI